MAGRDCAYFYGAKTITLQNSQCQNKLLTKGNKVKRCFEGMMPVGSEGYVAFSKINGLERLTTPMPLLGWDASEFFQCMMLRCIWFVHFKFDMVVLIRCCLVIYVTLPSYCLAIYVNFKPLNPETLHIVKTGIYMWYVVTVDGSNK
eukprot:4792815-Amphidinium_carterae.2